MVAMASPMAAARRALSDPGLSASDVEWSKLASELGVEGASLTEAVVGLADEQETFTSARSWRDLVQRFVAREDAFGRLDNDTPYPLLSICPTRGGPHGTLSSDEYEQILRRTTMAETEMSVLSSQAVIVVRNRVGTVWTVDLRSEAWGKMIWGLAAPVPRHTISVLVSGTYLIFQRLGA